GLSEIVDHQWTGMKVPADNSAILAEVIVELLKNEGLRKSIVTNAVEKLIHVYDWSIIADQTIKVYKRVFNEWKKHSWKIKEDTKKYSPKKSKK
ncbi:MAG: glycosyltransferase, partial [Candidatus Heimdallarchaeota archaeon]